MIIVSDAHIRHDSKDSDDFFSMLDAIGHTNHDIIFLGDIFELWIALPRYEQEIHKRFLQWCKKEKQNRTVGFVEGNHEFFLAEQHSDCFTWATTDVWLDSEAKILYAHGDQVNPNDKSYHRFRKATKNKLTKNLARYMPLAPQLIKYTKRKLTNRDKERGYFPEKTLHEYADNTFSTTVSTILLGHFHQDFRYQNKDNDLFLLPDWMATKKIVIYDKNVKELRSHHWSELQTRSAKEQS